MDIDRNDEQNHKESSNKISSSEAGNKKDQTAQDPQITEVENAHASGLGSMGRSDEKLKDKEKGKGQQDVVY